MTKKKKFEWKHCVHEDGTKQNGLFIDDELFDWEVDKALLADVFATQDERLIKEAQKSVELSFLECISDFVGRKITSEDVQKAEKTGWI